jgi:hypothetical protein
MKESPFISRMEETKEEKQRRLHKQIISRVLQHVRFIAEHFQQVECDAEVRLSVVIILINYI